MLVTLLYWGFIQTVYMLKLTISAIITFVQEEKLKYASKENFENYAIAMYGVMLFIIAGKLLLSYQLV